MPHLLRRGWWLATLLLLAACASAPQAPALVLPADTSAPLVGTMPSFQGVTFRRVTDTFGPWQNLLGLYSVGTYHDGPRDSTGVRVVIRNGVTYNHPVAQAQDGLHALTVYAADPADNAAMLTLAELEGNRLIHTHVTNSHTGLAWWYPYRFAFSEYADPNLTVHPLWYSGMAQGQALTLFTELYAATGNANWKLAAAHTFDSFLYPLKAGESKTFAPWVWRADSSQYLWIEEYPLPNINDDTMNGFGFAIYGLIEYARAFNDSRATLLAQGGLETFLRYLPLVRHPGGISSYSLSHLADRSASYHLIVTAQLQFFAGATGDARLATLANEFYNDYH